MTSPLMLRVECLDLGRVRVVDLATGQNIACRVPLAASRRLRRSFETGTPRKIYLFKVDDEGRAYLEGDRIATEPALVQVVEMVTDAPVVRG